MLTCLFLDENNIRFFSDNLFLVVNNRRFLSYNHFLDKTSTGSSVITSSAYIHYCHGFDGAMVECNRRPQI